MKAKREELELKFEIKGKLLFVSCEHMSDEEFQTLKGLTADGVYYELIGFAPKCDLELYKIPFTPALKLKRRKDA